MFFMLRANSSLTDLKEGEQALETLRPGAGGVPGTPKRTAEIFSPCLRLGETEWIRPTSLRSASVQRLAADTAFFYSGQSPCPPNAGAPQHGSGHA